MTAFTYNTTVPNPPNQPAVDVQDMQNNTAAINDILDVDHVTFNTVGPAGAGTPGASGGQHLQTTFNGKNVPGGAPTDPISILYTNSGTASSVSQPFFRNQNGIFPINLIAAYGTFDQNGNTLNASNLTCSGFVVILPGISGYNLTITAGIVNSTSYGVLVTPHFDNLTPTQSNIAPLYRINSSTSFSVSFRGAAGAVQQPANGFTVLVLQL